MTVNIDKIAELLGGHKAPLYSIHWPAAYLEIDEHGFVSAYYSQDDVQPEYITLMRSFRWQISNKYSPQGLIDLVDELMPDLDDLHEGHSVTWEGGSLDIKASTAKGCIHYWTEKSTGDISIRTAKYVSRSKNLKILWPKGTVLDAVDSILKNNSDKTYIYGDITSALLKRAHHLYLNASDEIEPHHTVALKQAGYI